MNKKVLYSREKKIVLTIEHTTKELLLIALSAKEKEWMLAEAQQSYSEAVNQLTEAAESIKAVYQLQTTELLMEALLQAEHDTFVAKAILTLPPDMAEDKGCVAAKAEVLINDRRQELTAKNKMQLIDKLIGLEMERQIHNMWTCAVLEATLARALYDDKRQRLFNSVEELKAAVTPELLEQLYELLLEFLAESGNAQVFLKPHISKG